MSDRFESELPGFYKLGIDERRTRIAGLTGLDERDVRALFTEGLSSEHANQMVENALGVLGMPLGVCVNLRVDGRDWLLPMAVEEPSVIAACSHASKLLRTGEGVKSEITAPIMVGQIQLLDVKDPVAARRAILAEKAALIELANGHHPALVAAGGGAIDVEVRELPRIEKDDPCGDMLIVHVVVDVRDAMGANAINSMAERLAPRVAALSGGRAVLRILSNLNDRRLVTVEGRVPVTAFAEKGGKGGRELAKGIEEASVFAERDPYRATTHNKGIMNGVDAVLLAFGQDFRAVEAAAHAYAARSGRYTAMAKWRVEGDHLVGRMTIPLAVGTVGGVFKVHPVVQVTRKIARIETTNDLVRLVAAAGLAQNLGALRALAAEGIQSGHMRLHARNVAVEAGATGDEVLEVATRIADRKAVNLRAATEELTALRAERARSPKPAVAPVPLGGGMVIDFSSRAPIARRGTPRPKIPVQPAAHVAPPTPPLEEEGPMAATRARFYTGKVLVTGATTLLGANLVRRLVADGRDVRAVITPGAKTTALDGVPVEKVWAHEGDLGAIERAMTGCRQAYHVSAMLSSTHATGDDERRALDGTRDVLRLAQRLGLERVVVTLTDAARASAELEAVCHRAHAEGLDVVVVAASTIVGPHDEVPSRLGRTLVDHAHGRLYAYLPGGVELLAARDAVEGTLRAMHRGRAGQRYTLSTSFHTLDELMDVFEEVTGRRRPHLRLPPGWMARAAEVSSRLFDRFAPSAPQRFTPSAVRLLTEPRRLDVSKARAELGFEPTSVRAAIHDAYADFARRGLVPARVGAEPSASSAGAHASPAPEAARTTA